METRRDQLLPLALVVFGIAFLLVYPLMRVWPSGWTWQPSQHEYEEMIVGIYATLGVFLLWASRAPLAHLSLIWFTVWSSVVHGGSWRCRQSSTPWSMGTFPATSRRFLSSPPRARLAHAARRRRARATCRSLIRAERRAAPSLAPLSGA